MPAVRTANGHIKQVSERVHIRFTARTNGWLNRQSERPHHLVVTPRSNVLSLGELTDIGKRINFWIVSIPVLIIVIHTYTIRRSTFNSLRYTG